MKRAVFITILIALIAGTVFGGMSMAARSQSNPTFGDTSVHSQSAADNGVLDAYVATLPVAGNVTSMSVYLKTHSGSNQVRMAIYSNSGGVLSTLLAQTSSVVAAVGWNTLSIGPVSLSAGTYWLAVQLSGTDNIAYDGGGTGATNRFRTYTYGSFPSTFGTASAGGWYASIYASYVVGPTPTPTPTPPPTPTAPSANPLQIAQLRWYEANQSNITFTTGYGPRGVCFDGANIWVLNSNGVSVTERRASDGCLVGTYPTGRTNPSGICFDGANIWVTNYTDGTVSKLRACDGSVVKYYTVGVRTDAICFDGANIWVTNDVINTVTKVRASDGSLLGSYSVGISPWAVCFDGANIWTADTGSNTVTKLRASDGSMVGTYAVGIAPEGICFDGVNVWVANAGGTVTKLRASDGASLGTYGAGGSPRFVCFDGANIWVTNMSSNSVTKLRARDGSLVGTYAVGFEPEGICFDGANIWVTNSGDNTVTKL